MIAPKEYRRSGATVNRYIATLSHVFSFALKDRRLIDRNPVGDIRLKKNQAVGRGFSLTSSCRRNGPTWT